MFSAAELAGFKSLVQSSFVHRYTRKAVSDGTVDTWKMAPPTYGSPTSDLICNFVGEGTIVTRVEGVTKIDAPTISVPDTDTIKTGDEVTNIVDQLGNVLHAGPLYAEVKTPVAGFGVLTNYIVSLRAQTPAAW